MGNASFQIVTELFPIVFVIGICASVGQVVMDRTRARRLLPRMRELGWV